MNPNLLQNGVPPQMRQQTFKQQIFQKLRSRPVPQGWQQTFRIDNRASFVHQITTQLFLLKPDNLTEARALEVAFTFEEREFFGSPDEQTYRAQCHKKLRDIANARQGQAEVHQQRLQNPSAQGIGGQQQMFQQGMVNPNQFQAGPNGVLPQQMTNAQNMARLQQAQFQQQQMANAARMQQQNYVNMQAAGAIPQQAPQGPGQQPFTPQERQLIEQRAQQMAVSLTDEQRQTIARKMQNVAPQTREQLAARGMNPIQLYVQNEAAKQYRLQKEREMIMQQNQGMPLTNSTASQQAPAPLMGIQQPGMNPQQQGRMPGVGNINQQILAQQQEAYRRQEAGHIVVPGQGMPPGVQQTQQQPQPQAQGPNPAWQIQNLGVFREQNQTLWNNAQGRQGPNPQPQSRTPNPTVTAQQPALQGQVGGLTNNPNLRPGQQTPAMPTLNQPMDPSGQNQTQTGPSPRPGQANNQIVQKHGLQGASAQPSDMNGQNNVNQQRTGPSAAALIQSMPQPMKNHFAALPSDAHRRQFLANLAKAQENKRKQNSQIDGGTAPLLQNTVQPQQVAENPAGNLNAQPAVNLSRPLNMGGQPMNASNQVNVGQPMNGRPATQNGMPNNLVLNNEQMRQMDGIDFPIVLRSNIQFLNGLPEGARTWAHLKQFISQNAHVLPPNILQKFIQQQAMHFFQIQQHRQKLAMQNGGVPTAQMMPGGQTQAQNMNAIPVAVPPLSQPTMQEVQSARNTIPNAQGMSDEQIRSAILRRKKQVGTNNNLLNQNYQGLNPQQQAQYNVLRMQQLQQNAGQNQASNQHQNQVMNQTQNTKSQNPQAPQQQSSQNRQPPTKAPQANMNQAKPSAPEQTKQTPGNRATPQGSQKNLKRNKQNDDVIEIADPKLTKPTLSNKDMQQVQVPNGAPKLTQQDFNNLSDQQKNQYMAQQQRQKQSMLNGQAQASQSNPVIDLSTRAEEIKRANRRLREILAEIARSMGRRSSQPMSPETRDIMIKKLRESQAMMGRVEMALTIFLMLGGNEATLRELARMQILWREQIRDNNFTPAENFTITSAELDDIVQKLGNHCHSIMSKVAPQQGGTRGASNQQPLADQTAQRANINNQQQQQQAPANALPQKLTAESLQQQQEDFQRSRTANLQKNHSNQKPPAAPTTSAPPFPFGRQSPQGVPLIYNPTNELTQDKLVLPAAKKRKANAGSAATTPAQSAQTPGQQSSPPAKMESPKHQRTSVQSKLKCTIADCKSKDVFATQADLEKHVVESHPPKEEEITDPLAYCLEGFRIVLNLDENGKSKDVASQIGSNNAQGPAMKNTTSMQGQNVKQEVSTPMSRNPTGTGPSPSASLLKTPQASNSVRTPASDTKSISQTITKPTLSKRSVASSPDSWASAKVPQNWFPTVFGDVASLNRPVPTDFLVSWLDRNPFNLNDSSDSSSAPSKHSPHASDISATDNLDINLTGDEGDNGAKWIPSDWLDDDLSGGLAASVLDPVLEMDWESTFGLEDGNSAKARKGEETGDAVSDEFLKVYAPEQLAERARREEERRVRGAARRAL